MFFADFAKTDEFWHCIELLKPGTQRTETISILKNSDGDDPPDLTVFFPSGPIGIELTDCSPITACVEKVSAAMRKGAAIPGASDAKTFQQVKEFMSRPRSFVKPRFTSLQREQETLISYLTEQIRRKDISGNDILLLAGSFMGGWPESEFATIAKELAEPRHIRFVVLVSQSRSTIV